MLSIEDEAILTEFEKDEQEHPSWRKIVDKNHVRYASRKLSLPRNDLWGQPVLCDLGEARIGNSHKGNIQPDIYNAPELLFDMPWRSSADIWNVGVMIWDIFENKHLFNELDENKEYPPSHHVAETVGYLGKWLGVDGVSIPSISMEESEENLSSQDKQQFLHFMRSMLQWVPEERKTAKELLDDPWLNST
ncbi:protein kinase domain protein [Aspergillus flavus]|nr:protein kinase domain protein [Aspergillus flavus]